MSRTFWMAVGAVGGIVAYRRGTSAAQRARELGPLGTAQVAAARTSSMAGRTANGLERLVERRARREGRLILGTAAQVEPGQESQAGQPVGDWAVRYPAPGAPVSGSPGSAGLGSGSGSVGPGTPRGMG